MESLFGEYSGGTLGLEDPIEMFYFCLVKSEKQKVIMSTFLLKIDLILLGHMAKVLNTPWSMILCQM